MLCLYSSLSFLTCLSSAAAKVSGPGRSAAEVSCRAAPPPMSLTGPLRRRCLLPRRAAPRRRRGLWPGRSSAEIAALCRREDPAAARGALPPTGG
ncbi:hypothetical protein ABZP36_025169 [Zizania latifolia]